MPRALHVDNAANNGILEFHNVLHTGSPQMCASAQLEQSKFRR